jgi:hypothetical protein
MANDDHIALLKKGVAAWNAWRDENRSIRPNLSDWGRQCERGKILRAPLSASGVLIQKA